jgi:hypothetical protein
MIYEKAIDPGTVLHNLQVIRVARGNPLIYQVRCLRPECGGSFEINHERLTGLGSDWCQWAGCNQTAKKRANRTAYLSEQLNALTVAEELHRQGFQTDDVRLRGINR